MDIEIWFGFALASAVLLAIPGPTVMIVVAQTLAHGRRSSWVAVPAVTLGDATAMTVSLAGAGAVLAASATLFTALKLAGAAYLLWLGLRLWRSPAVLPQAGEGALPLRADRWRLFRQAWLVTALNPKSIVFFVAFVPQFVDPARPLLPQLALMEATFLALAALNTSLWVAAAGRLRSGIGRPEVLRLLNRAGGGLLMGAGLLTALARRAV